jgi:hypothetical protein
LIISISIISIPLSSASAKAKAEASADKLKKISLDVFNLYLELDQSYKLTVEFEPKSSAKAADVKWKSSDSNVATVQNGTVFAKGLGTAYVYADCDTSIAYCKITVIRQNPVRAVQDRNYTGYEGVDLEVVTKAADVLDKNIKATMTDEEKIEAIHNYLVMDSKYDPSNDITKTAPNSVYGIIGPLVKNTAIREGYSYTFKYFMDILDIDCRICDWHGYVWNQVYLNGNWYNIDITISFLTNVNGQPQNYKYTLYTPLKNSSEIMTMEDINFEYILYKYREDDYSGNEAAVKAYLRAKDIAENKKKDVIQEEFTVTLNPNYSFSKQFPLSDEAISMETVKGNENFIPYNLPQIKGNAGIYVSSLNTKADGTGISYPDNMVYGVKENMYLYCIWSVDIPQAKLTLTSSKGGFISEWSQVAGCKNYQLRYSTDSSMKNATTKKVTGQKTSISGLRKKETYYVQVRGYIKDDRGNITYGKWSTKKKVIIAL